MAASFAPSVPVLAASLAGAFIMVSWDVAMDPYQSTVTGDWIWHDGGGYFGAHPYQGQQAAVPREPVRVHPGHGGLHARAPYRGEYQRDRGYQQPPCG